MTILRWVMLLPRNAAIGVLRMYRTLISPLYGDVCRYYPSCSAYALGSVQQRGLLMGSALGLVRIFRCHPWAAGGVDDVRGKKDFRYRITSHGFVVASERKG